MSKISRNCIAMMAAVLMLVCGGNMYAYKGDINGGSDLSGHRHIVIEALKLFRSQYPDFHELNDSRIESDAVDAYVQRIYGPTEVICDTVLTIFPVREERTLGMGSGNGSDTYGEVIAWGAQNEDEYDYVYLDPIFGQDLYCGAKSTQTHFWDADLGPTAGSHFGIEDFFGIGDYPNSWQKVAIPETDFTQNFPSLWDQAIDAYASNKTKAYERLGHVVHLLEDGTVPAHAHLDTHGPGFLAGFLDAYEEWSIFDGDPGVDDLSEWYNLRSGFDPAQSTLIDMPDEFDIFFAVQDQGWSSGVPTNRSKLELFYLFYTANQTGDYFDSWRHTNGALSNSGDANIISFLPGNPAAIPWIDYNDGSWDSPNAHVLDEVAEKSYLHAIRATATVFELFLMEVGELPPRPGLVCPPNITLPCGSDTKPDITGQATVSTESFAPFQVPVVTFSDVLDLDGMGGLATITRTWRATNEFGFTETCDQIITINNTIPPTIFLSGTGTDLGIDDDADGAFDNLQVNLDVFLLSAHHLNLSARLIDSDGGTIDISSSDVGFFPLGPGTLSLSFDGDKIGEHGIDGPYTVVDLVFRGSECDVFSVDYITDTYAASEFSGFAGVSTGQSGTGGNSGCFVATAAYGTPMAADINVLRHFRDEDLLTSRLGTLFVDGYYRSSPPLADFVAQHPAAAATVRVALIPLLFLLSSPWAVATMVLLLAGALLVGRQVRVVRHRSTAGISFLILALLAFSTPVQAHVALIDASGLEFLIDTDFHGSASTTSSEAVEASYIAPVPADTASGGVTMSILDDAFDGYGTLKIFAGGEGRVTYGNNGPATLIDGGRSILFGTEVFGEFDEVLVTREVFVPEDDEFCRWLTRIRNVGTETAFVLVRIRNDLGSDDLTRIHATASGDTTAGADDNWVVSFEDFIGDNSFDPRLGHVFQNSGARVQLTAMRFFDGDDEPNWDYELEILPGEVQTIMHFVTGQPTLADAVSGAEALALTSGSALDFMSPTEMLQVVNFELSAEAAAAAAAAAVGSGSNPCFVATAAYGTPMAEDIDVLRHFRDEVLLTSLFGALFVDSYYRTSPPIAEFVAQHPAAAATVRVALIPLLFMLSSPWTDAPIVLLLVVTLFAASRQLRTAQKPGFRSRDYRVQ